MPPKKILKKGKAPQTNQRVDNEKKNVPDNKVPEAEKAISVIEENRPGISVTTKIEALKTKVISLTLELKEAKNEINKKQQEIDELKKNGTQVPENGSLTADKSKKDIKPSDKPKPTQPLDKPKPTQPSDKTKPTEPSEDIRVKPSDKTQSAKEIKIRIVTKDDETDSDDSISAKSKSELQFECRRLSRKVIEMEKFFSDYGLVWVGEEGCEDECGENACEMNDGIRMTHTSRTFSPNFQKVFSSIDELNIMATEPQIIHTKSGATFKQCELLNLNLYSDGMQLENDPFREYSSESVQEFFQDIEDGYYPSELKGSFPNGVVFKVIDKRHQTYAEYQGFSGKGQKLGGKNGSTRENCEQDSGNGGQNKRTKPKKIYVYETKFQVVSHKTNKTKAEGDSAGEDQNENKTRPSNNSKNKRPSNMGDGKHLKDNNIPTNNVVFNNRNETKVENTAKSMQNEKETFIRTVPTPKSTYSDVKITEINDYKQISSVPASQQPRDFDIKITELKDENENVNIPNQSLIKSDKKFTNESLKINKVIPPQSELQINDFTVENENIKNPRSDRKSTQSFGNSSRQRHGNPDNRSTRNGKDKSKNQTHPVIAISTDTSDHFMVNLPTHYRNETDSNNEQSSTRNGQRPSTSRSRDHVPYNITNINYREAPVNINITPDVISLLKDDLCPSLQQRPTQRTKEEIPESCRNRMVIFNGKEYSCGNDCPCGCGDTEIFTSEPEIKVKRGTDYTEYQERFKESAKNIEDNLRKEPPPKVTPRRIDPEAHYEHFTFLGHFDDDEVEETTKENPSKKPFNSLNTSSGRTGQIPSRSSHKGERSIPLNDRTSPSQIAINVEVNNENYLAYVRPQDPVSKVISLLKTRPEIPADQEIQPKIIVANINNGNTRKSFFKEEDKSFSGSLKKEIPVAQNKPAEHKLERKSSQTKSADQKLEEKSNGSSESSEGSDEVHAREPSVESD